MESFDENSSGSSQGTENTQHSEVNEMAGHGALPTQVSSSDGMQVPGIQAIQIPSSNGQNQQTTVVQFNGQVSHRSPVSLAKPCIMVIGDHKYLYIYNSLASTVQKCWCMV